MKMKYFAFLLIFPNLAFALDRQEFNEVRTALELAFSELRPDSSHSLHINDAPGFGPDYWWQLPMVHASYSKLELQHETKHHIFLFGGFARQPGMTKDGLAETACHEIGHGIGGAPYKTSGSSTEGQADYFATKTCLPIVFKHLQEQPSPNDPYLTHLCETYNPIDPHCLRSLKAIQSDVAYFRNYENADVAFDFASAIIADTVNTDPTYYPEPQCRLDTAIHGALQLPRPRCWFPKGIQRAL